MWKKELEEKILFFKKYCIDQKIKYEILDLIHSYLPDSNIIIRSRIKDFNSASYKYKQKNYQTIHQMKDLIGIMIICNNKKEIYKVKECIEEHKKVIKIKDYIKNPKKGYRSIHLYVQKREDLIYEIQIKTKPMQITQQLVHDKLYKNFNIPEWIKKIISPIIFNILLSYENLKNCTNYIFTKTKKIEMFFS